MHRQYGPLSNSLISVVCAEHIAEKKKISLICVIIHLYYYLSCSMNVSCSMKIIFAKIEPFSVLEMSSITLLLIQVLFSQLKLKANLIESDKRNSITLSVNIYLFHSL